MNRPTQKRVSNRRLAELRNNFRKQRGCFYPNGQRACAQPSIQSHTIQRSTSLREVSGPDFHVLTFYPGQKDEAGELILQRRGWHKASTFLGFCERHDSTVFAPLEAQPFTASAQQLFLVAYRAHCHELYQKLSLVDAATEMRRQNDILRKDIADNVYDGARKALLTLEKEKSAMDSQLVASDYRGWSSLVLYFDGPLSVTGTGATTPNCDFEQNELQDLTDRSTPNQYLYFAAVPSSTGIAFVMTWRTGDGAPKRFAHSLGRLPVDRLPHILFQFMFAYCENTYFSQSWWESLSNDLRIRIRGLAGNPNPYHSLLDFKNAGVSPWVFSRAAHAESSS